MITNEIASSRAIEAMEGQGAYNRHSSRQADRTAFAIPFLQQAARSIGPEPYDRPLMIADYGSSQGRNSLVPLNTAVAVLRERFGIERAICVAHTDLATNDFNTLFDILDNDPQSYLKNRPNVFASAIGRSFYQVVLPRSQVALGWSASAVHWLSRVPALVPGHFFYHAGTEPVRAAFAKQAAEDWRTFLSSRAQELRPTGRLVVVLPVLGEDGRHGIEPLLDVANASLAELTDCGAIAPSERADMVVPAYWRTRSELLAPFCDAGSFNGLVLERCEFFRVPDAAWASYRQHGEARRLASERATWFRTAFVPTLATALVPGRAEAHRRLFAGKLQAVLTRRLESTIFEITNNTAVIVFARQ
jgi:hypothetical protein